MTQKFFALALALNICLATPVALADGLLPAKSPEIIEVSMPDGNKQKGFIKDGVFVPIAGSTEQNAQSATQQPAPAKTHKLLPPGTPVQVAIDKEVDADEVKVGEMIEGHLVMPVKHEGVIVFPAGTPVKGSVTRRKNNSIAGVSGSIELGNFKIMTPEGGVLPLTGTFQRKGNSRVAGSLVGAYFIGLPIFVKGQDGKVESGAESTMYTVQEWEY